MDENLQKKHCANQHCSLSQVKHYRRRGRRQQQQQNRVYSFCVHIFLLKCVNKISLCSLRSSTIQCFANNKQAYQIQIWNKKVFDKQIDKHVKKLDWSYVFSESRQPVQANEVPLSLSNLSLFHSHTRIHIIRPDSRLKTMATEQKIEIKLIKLSRTKLCNLLVKYTFFFYFIHWTRNKKNQNKNDVVLVGL